MDSDRKLQRKMRLEAAELAALKKLKHETDQQLQFYRTRCLQLEIALAQSQAAMVPRVCKDPTIYKGTDLIERELVIDKLLRKLAGEGPESGKEYAGTIRFASTLERGPTADYN